MAAASVTGRVTPGAAPPSAPAPAPALSFPPGPSGEGSQGSPGRRRPGPCLLAPRLGRTRPGGRPSSSPGCALPASLPGASPAPRSPCLRRREDALLSAGRGGPGGRGGGLPGLQPGLGVGGHPGASQRPDFTRSCCWTWDLNHTDPGFGQAPAHLGQPPLRPPPAGFPGEQNGRGPGDLTGICILQILAPRGSDKSGDLPSFQSEQPALTLGLADSSLASAGPEQPQEVTGTGAKVRTTAGQPQCPGCQLREASSRSGKLKDPQGD